MMRKTPLLHLPLLRAGRTTAVEYGDIPQSTLAQNPRYKPAQSDAQRLQASTISSLPATCLISAAAFKRLPD